MRARATNTSQKSDFVCDLEPLTYSGDPQPCIVLCYRGEFTCPSVYTYILSALSAMALHSRARSVTFRGGVLKFVLGVLRTWGSAGLCQQHQLRTWIESLPKTVIK